jgi:hypothetical protein
MHLALLVLSVSIAGQSPAAMPPAPAWTILPGAEILARIDLLGCPEGNVLDWVQPSAEVNRYFQRPQPWGDEWINALTAPPRWKMPSSMHTVREEEALLDEVFGKDAAARRIVLEHSTLDDRCLIAGDADWRDCTVAAAIRVAGKTAKPNIDEDVHVVPMAGIMLRAQTVRSYYFFAIEPKRGFTLYARDDDAWSVLASAPGTIDPKRYYRLRASALGDTLRCYEADRKLFELRDRRLAHGKAGVRMNTDVRVAWVSVSMTPAERQISDQARAARLCEEQELERKLPRPVLWRTIDLAALGGSPLGFVPTRAGKPKDIILAGGGKQGAAIMAVTLDGTRLWECRGSMRIPQIGGPLKDGTYRLTGILARKGEGEILAAINLCDGSVVAQTPVPSLPGRKLEFMFTTNSLADLRGVGAPSDFILREGNDGNALWAYDDQLRLLWTTSVVPNFGHGNAFGFCDVNGDGREEILAGGSLLAPDGHRLWQMERVQEVLKKNGGVHIDAAVLGNIAGDARLDPVVSLQAGSAGVYFLDARTGKVLSHTPVGHAQGRFVGKFRPDVPGLQVEVGNRWGNYGIISIFSAQGKRLCTFQPDTLSQGGPPVNWTGDGQEHIFVYTSPQGLGFYDGWGRRVLRFVPGEFPEGVGYGKGVVYVEDLTGDPRDELAAAIGGKLYIYTQSRGPENPQKVYSPVRRSVISFPGWSAG